MRMIVTIIAFETFRSDQDVARLRQLDGEKNIISGCRTYVGA